MLKMFSVYDSKAQAYLPPFFSPTTGTAVRSFQVACQTEGHDFHRFGSDFTLFELGDFDEAKATMHMHSTPQNLGLAIGYVGDEGSGYNSEQREALPTSDDVRKLHAAD